MGDGPAYQATVLLIGTGHWGNPGLDYRNVVFDDMQAPGRQREIEGCLARLARFNPTKVALEISGDLGPAMNEDYRRYRAGAFALTANERHQLGFRLAAMADHTEVYGIDWHDLARPIPWDRAIAYALEHGQDHLVPLFASAEAETEREQAAEAERVRRMSVRDHLLATNAPEAMAASHRVYMDLAQVGDGDTYVGAEVVLRWYERNMMMFVNIARLATSPEERILVVVGGGHLALLSHFVRDAGQFRLEHVADYLA